MEERDARAEQDRHHEEDQLVEQAGPEELPDEVRAADEPYIAVDLALDLRECVGGRSAREANVRAVPGRELAVSEYPAGHLTVRPAAEVRDLLVGARADDDRAELREELLVAVVVVAALERIEPLHTTVPIGDVAVQARRDVALHESHRREATTGTDRYPSRLP